MRLVTLTGLAGSVFLTLLGGIVLSRAGLLNASANLPPPSTVWQETGMVAGLPFADPPDASATSGAHAAVILTAEATRFNLSGKQVWGDSYNGSFVGPTLHVEPGDQLDVTLANQLRSATNLHFHGMHVSPSGDADNVSLSLPPGQSFEYHLQIPPNHPQGTFWYHDHDLCTGNGNASMPAMSPAADAPCTDVESQIFAGLAGTIIVGDNRRLLPPELRGITTHTLAFKDVQIDRSNRIVQNSGTTSIDSNRPAVRLVNGLLRPVLATRPGETQLWRLANEGANIFYDLQLQGYRFSVIGEDGYPVTTVTVADSLLLPPGKRYDVLVTAASQPGATWLRTLAYSNGPQGDSYPQSNLVELRVIGEPQSPAPLPDAPLATAPADLAGAPMAQSRTLTLSENSDGTVMFINGKQFDMRQSVFSTPAAVGTVEQWTIVNTSGEVHPFHLHTGHFQVMSVNGVPRTFTGEQDTIPVPGQQHGVPGQVVIRVLFGDYPGQWMFHCHIAAHEGAGMMSFINVVPAVAAGPGAR